jgi:uncharacterized damage-inducible protein DinB
MGGQTLFTMKKGDCLRKWVFCHSAHHRGILSVYLRMAAVQFRSIYEEQQQSRCGEPHSKRTCPPISESPGRVKSGL